MLAYCRLLAPFFPCQGTIMRKQQSQSKLHTRRSARPLAKPSNASKMSLFWGINKIREINKQTTCAMPAETEKKK
jgi:hypothetical protein